MVSHEFKVIFIHIPKAAGTSIEMKLGLFHEPGWGKQDHRTLREIRPLSMFSHSKYILNRRYCNSEGMSRREMLSSLLGISSEPNDQGRGRVTKAQFESYYKFAVIRNPWARVYSWYRNVMRDHRHGVPTCSFPEFLSRWSTNWALRPQLYWLRDFDGSLPYDRIVRFENLLEEVQEVFREIGLQDTKLPHALHSKSDTDYRTAYDDASAELVGCRYKEEIELFGYEFGK